jgi:hypothetical protein
MLYTTQNPSPKYATLPAKTAIEIVAHREDDQGTIFTYLIPISIDQSIIEQVDGDLQVRGFLGQKRQDKIVVKKSIAVSGNILKSVGQQRQKQITDRKFERRFFVKKNIDRPDLNQELINFLIDVRAPDINDTFIVEIAHIRSDGFTSIVDLIDVDHAYTLRRYDLPNQDFILTTTRNSGRKIYASAVCNDDVVGSFKFYLKNESSSNFLKTRFENMKDVLLDGTNQATVIFDVADNDQVYSILAKPITKFYKQELGNSRKVTSGFIKDVKYLPFYMESIDDKTVRFRITGIDQTIDRVFLYRRFLPSGERTIVDSKQNLKNGILIVDAYRHSQYDTIYTLEYLDNGGILQTSQSEVIVPALKLDTLAKISVNRIDNQETNQIGNFVSFNVDISYRTDTIMDQITKDLRSLGLENLLSSELEKTTNNLKPLVRVLVTQISLIDGVEHDVGIYEPGIIKIPVSREDELGSIYRFEVAVRSVPEALETITAAQNLISLNAYNLKSDVDLASKSIGNKVKTGRTSYSAKFFTKNSIRNSLLRYGEASEISDTTFYAGRTGIFYDIQISPIKKTFISTRNITFISTRKGNYVKWGFTGDISNLDYFEINVDGKIFYSYPSGDSNQIFHLGGRKPSIIEITPVVGGSRNESGTDKIEVQ